MTWIRLDDQFLAHPKVVGLSNDQLALWLAGLAYCNQQCTDGFIPAIAVIRVLAPSRGVDPGEADALVAAGLWERTQEGFFIHDYGEYQPTKEKLAERRRQYRDSKQASRALARVHRGHAVESTPRPRDVRDREEEEDLLISELTERSSSSSPSTPGPPWTNCGQRIAQQLREVAGIESNGAVRDDIEDMLANSITEEFIVAKIRACARRNAKGWEYVARAIENDWRAMEATA